MRKKERMRKWHVKAGSDESEEVVIELPVLIERPVSEWFCS